MKIGDMVVIERDAAGDLDRRGGRIGDVGTIVRHPSWVNTPGDDGEFELKLMGARGCVEGCIVVVWEDEVAPVNEEQVG